ncbi:hypothetical protein Dsin_004751 [Dipteronia sinensis]|uniref:Putative plant transposon protein domain-containing protein n=1 Tax=Dipteronia sinensis TaxID=43782 RepID=A0AAE0EE90_9ROSI|nr:hypothetical protein Dsin_004751 [Dipteronia sinensis]
MYHVRLQQMLSRTVHPERCIDLTYVDGSDVVRLADAIGWRQFVITPRTTANFSIVRESYTSMIFEEYHKGKPVKVRGVDVFVCPQEINGYYDTAAHAALKKGMPDNMIFQLYHLELATTLRRNMDNMGEWSVNRSLRQSELEKDLAFWSVSISHSLRTFMQRTKTVLEVAQILYCIKHQLQIDVGQQICDAIYRARKKSTSILPFPCMITDLCLRAGVALSNDDEIKGLSDPYEEYPGAVSSLTTELVPDQRPTWFDIWSRDFSEQRPAWFDVWVRDFSQHTPQWAMKISEEVAKLRSALETSTLIAIE